jgi:hypothetical protein
VVSFGGEAPPNTTSAIIKRKYRMPASHAIANPNYCHIKTVWFFLCFSLISSLSL